MVCYFVNICQWSVTRDLGWLRANYGWDDSWWQTRKYLPDSWWQTRKNLPALCEIACALWWTPSTSSLGLPGHQVLVCLDIKSWFVWNLWVCGLFYLWITWSRIIRFHLHFALFSHVCLTDQQCYVEIEGLILTKDKWRAEDLRGFVWGMKRKTWKPERPRKSRIVWLHGLRKLTKLKPKEAQEKSDAPAKVHQFATQRGWVLCVKVWQQ